MAGVATRGWVVSKLAQEETLYTTRPRVLRKAFGVVAFMTNLFIHWRGLQQWDGTSMARPRGSLTPYPVGLSFYSLVQELVGCLIYASDQYGAYHFPKQVSVAGVCGLKQYGQSKHVPTRAHIDSPLFVSQ